MPQPAPPMSGSAAAARCTQAQAAAAQAVAAREAERATRIDVALTALLEAHDRSRTDANGDPYTARRLRKAIRLVTEIRMELPK